MIPLDTCLVDKDPSTCGVKRAGKGCDHCPAYSEYTPAPIPINKVEWGAGQSFYHTQAPEPKEPDIMSVDARVHGGMMTLCEFAGHEFDSDKKRRCKFYDKSSVSKWRCMYYRETMDCCDCINKEN